MRTRVTALTPSMRNLLRWLLKQPNHAAEAPHRLGITATCTALHKRGLVTTWVHDNGPRWARLTDKGRTAAAQLPAPGLRDLPAPVPLSEHALDVLARIAGDGPISPREINPGVRRRLLRDGLIDYPTQVITDRPVVTDAGRAKLAAARP